MQMSLAEKSVLTPGINPGRKEMATEIKNSNATEIAASDRQ